MAELLRIAGLAKRFGGIAASDGVDLVPVHAHEQLAARSEPEEHGQSEGRHHAPRLRHCHRCLQSTRARVAFCTPVPGSAGAGSFAGARNAPFAAAHAGRASRCPARTRGPPRSRTKDSGMPRESRSRGLGEARRGFCTSVPRHRPDHVESALASRPCAKRAHLSRVSLVAECNVSVRHAKAARCAPARSRKIPKIWEAFGPACSLTSRRRTRTSRVAELLHTLRRGPGR